MVFLALFLGWPFAHAERLRVAGQDQESLDIRNAILTEICTKLPQDSGEIFYVEGLLAGRKPMETETAKLGSPT